MPVCEKMHLKTGSAVPLHNDWVGIYYSIKAAGIFKALLQILKPFNPDYS